MDVPAAEWTEALREVEVATKEAVGAEVEEKGEEAVGGATREVVEGFAATVEVLPAESQVVEMVVEGKRVVEGST